MFGPDNVRIRINGKPLNFAQAINIGISVHDILAEAKFICCREPFETDENGEAKEIESVGVINGISLDIKGVLTFDLHISPDAPNANYFEKYYKD